MRNVMIVVPVLITSCHVSLKPKNGPVIAHTTTRPTAITATNGRAAKRAAVLAQCAYHDLVLIASIVSRGGNAASPCLRPTCVGRVLPTQSDKHRPFLPTPKRHGHRPNETYG